MKNNKAITLIALVITIVVLIILAAVAINLSLGNNGIFNRAKTAKEQYQNAETDENKSLYDYGNEIDNLTTISNREGDSNEWTLYKMVVGSEQINIDFSKYKNVKFIASQLSTNNVIRVLEATFPSTYFLEDSNTMKHVLMGAADGWFYCALYVKGNIVYQGGATNNGQNCTSTSKLYVYVQ